VQVALGGAAEVDGHVLDPGQDQQDLGAQPDGEQGRGQVLVDHRLDPGSMLPKVQAALRFLEEGGRRAVITTPELSEKALAGEIGTQLTSSSP